MSFVELPKAQHTNPRKPGKCVGCPAMDAPGPVWSSQHPNPKLVIVGEAPGEDELGSGMGFTGSSGWLLWKLLKGIGISREDCYVANVAKCLTKHPGAFKVCYDRFLKEELAALPEGTKIIALGGEAKEVLLPQLAGVGILKARGTIIGNIGCALHPAYIRRTQRHLGGGDDMKGEKQDMTPTIAHDIEELLRHTPVEVKQYVEGIPIGRTQQEMVSCDIETGGHLEAHQAPPTEIGFGVSPGLAYRERYQHSGRERYDEWLSGPTVFHNMLFDVPYLRHHGHTVDEPHDTMGLSHLLWPDMPLKLEFVNGMWCHYPPWKKSTRKSKPEFYHGTDLDTTIISWQAMEREARRLGDPWRLYNEEWLPVTKLCCEMKQRGIRIDHDKMIKLNIGLGMKIDQIDIVLAKACPGVDFNSPQQVMHLLYDVMKLPVQYNRQTGNRTSDAEALEALGEVCDHPVLQLLLQRRAMEKLKSTYTDYSIDANGFMHHDISFTNATGRARGFLLTIQKGAMRSLFIPDFDDWEFCYADWEQIELWISAVVSGDKAMQEVLSRGSFHAYVAHGFFGGPQDKSNPKYNETKFITHGLNFGRGEQSIKQAHGVDVSTTRGLTKYMAETFLDWGRWRQSQLHKAQTLGYLKNCFGHTRGLWSGNIKGMAYSFDPQSIPAHMIKRTIMSLWDELPQPARIVLPVHDALLVAYPTVMREEVLPIVKEHMEQPWPQLGGWRARCEISYGANWQVASDDKHPSHKVWKGGK